MIEVGKLLTDYDAKRDAIHVAVLPARAYVQLTPGAKVFVDDEGDAMKATRSNAMGIVDPFLDTDVEAGKMFWVFMLPGSVEALRHTWSHPNLQDERSYEEGFEEGKEKGKEESKDEYDRYDECRFC